MPVAIHICPTQMTKEDYERITAELKATGCDQPSGRLYHAAYGDDEIEIFEVWESPEQFHDHQNKTFLLIQAAGVDAGAGRVRVERLHSEHPD